MDVQPGVKKPSDFEKLLIMNTKEFKELVEKRKVWVECTKANKFDFELLSSLYRDPSHFISKLSLYRLKLMLSAPASSAF